MCVLTNSDPTPARASSPRLGGEGRVKSGCPQEKDRSRVEGPSALRSHRP